jgi:hypothetical protein
LARSDVTLENFAKEVTKEIKAARKLGLRFLTSPESACFSAPHRVLGGIFVAVYKGEYPNFWQNIASAQLSPDLSRRR